MDNMGLSSNGGNDKNNSNQDTSQQDKATLGVTVSQQPPPPQPTLPYKPPKTMMQNRFPPPGMEDDDCEGSSEDYSSDYDSSDYDDSEESSTEWEELPGMMLGHLPGHHGLPVTAHHPPVASVSTPARDNVPNKYIPSEVSSSLPTVAPAKPSVAQQRENSAKVVPSVGAAPLAAEPAKEDSSKRTAIPEPRVHPRPPSEPLSPLQQLRARLNQEQQRQVQKLNRLHDSKEHPQPRRRSESTTTSKNQAGALSATSTASEEDNNDNIKRPSSPAADKLREEIRQLRVQLEQKDVAVAESGRTCGEQAARIEELKRELEQQEEHLNASYNQTLDQLVVQIADLEQRLFESNKVAEFLEQVEHDGFTVDGIIQRSAELEEELDEIRRELDDKKEQMASSQKTCQEQAARIAELEKEMAEMEDHLNQSYNSTLDQLMGTINDLKERLSESNQQVEDLQKDLQEAKNKDQGEGAPKQQQLQMQQIEQIKNQLKAQVKVQFEAMKTQLVNQQDELAAKNQECQVQAERIKSLEEEMVVMEDELNESYNETLEQLTEQMNALQEALEESQAEAEELRNQAAATAQKVGCFQAREHDLLRQVDILKQQQQHGTQSSEGSAEKPSQVAASSSEQAAKLGELVEQVADLENRLSVAKNVVDFLKEQLKQAQEDKSAKDERIQELETKIKALQAAVEERDEDLANQEARLAEAERNLEDTLHCRARDKEAHAKEIDTIKAQSLRQNSDVALWEAQLEDKDQDISRLECEINDAKQALEETRSSLAIVQKDKEALECRYQEEMAEKSRLQVESERQREIAREALSDADEQKNAVENRLLERISELTAKLNEANRVAKLVRDNGFDQGNEEGFGVFRVKEFENQINLLKAELEGKEQELEFRNQKTKEQAAREEKMARQMIELEARLAVTNQVAEFLQSESRARGEKWLDEETVQRLNNQIEGLKEKLQAREQELGDQDRTCSEQADRIQALIDQVSDLESKLATCKKEVETETSRSSKLLVEKDRINEKTIVFESQLADLRAQLRTREQEVESRARDANEYATKISNMASMISTLESRLAQSDSEIRIEKTRSAQLIREKVEFQNKSQELETDLIGARAQLQEAEQKLESQAALSSEKALEIDQLNSQILGLQGKIAELTNVVEQKEAHSAEIEAGKWQYQAMSKDLESELSDLKSKLTQTEQELQGMAEKSSAQVAKIEIMKELISNLEVNLAESRTEAKVAGFRLEGVQSENSRLKSKADELEAGIASLKAKFEERDANLKEQSKRCQDQESKIKELSDHVMVLEANLTKSKKMAEFEQTRSSELEAKTSESGAKVEELESLLKHLQTQLDAQSQNDAESSNVVDAEQSKAAELEAKFVESQANVKELESLLNCLKEQLCAKEKDAEARTKKSTEQAVEMAEMRQEISSLESRLSDAINEIEVLKSQTSSERREKEATCAKAEALVRELDALRDLIKEKDKLITSRAEECDLKAKEVERLNKEMVEKEVLLEKSYNESLSELVQQVADLEGRLADSNKVLEFLQRSASQEDPSVSIQQEKNEELEAQVGALQVQLQEKELDIEARRLDADEKSSQMEDLTHQIMLLEAKLTEAVQESENQQNLLLQVETERKIGEATSLELKAQLANAVDRLQRTEEEDRSRRKNADNLVLSTMEGLVAKVADLERRLADKEESALRSIAVNKDAESRRQNRRKRVVAVVVAVFVMAAVFGVNVTDRDLWGLVSNEGWAVRPDENVVGPDRNISSGIIDFVEEVPAIVDTPAESFTKSDETAFGDRQRKSLINHVSLPRIRISHFVGRTSLLDRVAKILVRSANNPEEAINGALREKSVVGFYSAVLATVVRKSGQAVRDVDAPAMLMGMANSLVKALQDRDNSLRTALRNNSVVDIYRVLLESIAEGSSGAISGVASALQKSARIGDTMLDAFQDSSPSGVYEAMQQESNNREKQPVVMAANSSPGKSASQLLENVIDEASSAISSASVFGLAASSFQHPSTSRPLQAPDTDLLPKKSPVIVMLPNSSEGKSAPHILVRSSDNSSSRRIFPFFDRISGRIVSKKEMLGDCAAPKTSSADSDSVEEETNIGVQHD